jgi:hypothetical protein
VVPVSSRRQQQPERTTLPASEIGKIAALDFEV